ncbi:MAG: TrbI/VirB10 family protein [Fusobacterium sp.]|nr:TrbI/VirB10 family protein [Fusobacterium sp.]
MSEEKKEKETPQEDINKKLIKKPTVKIKKSFVLALIAVVIVVITYAFINASIKVKKANSIQKSQEANKEEVSKKTASNLDFLESDYSKLKKMEEEEKTYRELVKVEEEKKVEDSVLGPNIKMEEYYTQLLQEEMQSRLSDIDYSIISKNNNTKAEISTSTEESKNINLDTEYNKHSLKEAKSPYELKAGSFIPGILVSGVDSQIEGKMIGLVRENVYDSIAGKHLLIPKGTKIVGEYSSGVAYGQDRIFIIWQRLIFPNGKSLLLENFPGVDLSAYAGMKGRVNNHNIELFKSVILSSILGGGAALVDRNKDTRIQSWKNAMASGAGERILDIGDSLAERILNIKPTITIKPGSRFNIIVNADLILEPYKE